MTSQLVVRTDFLRAHPDSVRRLVQGSVESNRQIGADPGTAQRIIGEALGRLTGKPLAPAVLDRAFGQIRTTNDPIASSLKASARHAFDTGLVPSANLTGIYDLGLLREVLGKPVDDAGLGARG